MRSGAVVVLHPGGDRHAGFGQRREQGFVQEFIAESAVEAQVKRCDRPGTLFCLDPPYWGSEDYYGKKLFERADYKRLAEQLAAIKGRFVLSLNDTPGVRTVFSQFKMSETPALSDVKMICPKTWAVSQITAPKSPVQTPLG